MKSTKRSWLPGRLAPRSYGALLACGVACAAGAMLPAAGCGQQTVQVATRALERSGRSAFVCLGSPTGQIRPQLPLEACTGTLVTSINQYVGTDGGSAAVVPHLYALVTQTTRGEVAVIDTTSTNNSVLDVDPSIPGASFLPIGAQPIDIVATPGGTAIFVGVAEVGREAIFALPSAQIRPRASSEAAGSGAASEDQPPPGISSWPACRLPVAPGAMILLSDPPDAQGGVRESCDAPGYTTSPDGDPAFDLGQEKLGRQKLVVALPDVGGLVVIDAQTLLDRPAGSFDPCPVERWLPLDTKVPAVAKPPPPTGDACVNPKVEPPTLAASYTSRPSGLSYAAGRLYVSDLNAPLIHVLDMATPCEPIEITPLLPTSVEDPNRIVTTTHVAVSPDLTLALKRFLYAIDADDGSAMVFDVSDNALSALPLRRNDGHPEWNPFEPPDRIRYSAPAADLMIVQRDVPVINPATGVAAEGIRCDPSPTLTANCTTADTCDVATAYRTSSTYDSGAGPRKLRGTFALMALTSGRIAVIDIDDYDAPCRVPEVYSALLGCEAANQQTSALCDAATTCNAGSFCPSNTPGVQGFCTFSCSQTDTSKCTGGSFCTDALGSICGLASSAEASCNMVQPNAPRSGVYAAAGSASGRNVPGLTIFPLLFDQDGTLVASDGASVPRMVATLPAEGTVARLDVSVGGAPKRISGVTGAIQKIDDQTDDSDKHILAMNLEDPRAQLVDQSWAVTFEGTIPGFDRKAASLLSADELSDEITQVRDTNSRFCAAGVHSENAVRALLGENASDDEAARLADYVQIASGLVDQNSAYWKTDDLPASCNFQLCQATFGDASVPQTTRDLRIVEAYEDHVDVATRDLAKFVKVDATGAPIIVDQNGTKTTIPATADEVGQRIRCCFPGQVAYSVRAGNQWVVRGDASGFLHHVIADPATGACRDACDPRLQRNNSRVEASPADAPVADGTPRVAFINPMFRFAVHDDTFLNPDDTAKRRNFQFRFTTQGSFVPLLVDLATDASTSIVPVGMSFVKSTGDVAITDGSINGLLFMNLASVALTRQFF